MSKQNTKKIAKFIILDDDNDEDKNNELEHE